MLSCSRRIILMIYSNNKIYSWFVIWFYRRNCLAIKILHFFSCKKEKMEGLSLSFLFVSLYYLSLSLLLLSLNNDDDGDHRLLRCLGWTRLKKSVEKISQAVREKTRDVRNSHWSDTQRYIPTAAGYYGVDWNEERRVDQLTRVYQLTQSLDKICV